MQPTPELINRVAEWRRKIADNTMTLEEMRAAIVYLRGGRSAAVQAASESKARSKKAPARSAESLLNELGI